MSGGQKGVVNFSGKSYKMVGLRVAEFRDKYPPESGWSITSELVHCGDDFAVMKTTIIDPEGRAISTGYARDSKTDSKTHATSWLELAETSAVGRALGLFSKESMGDDYNIASAEEVGNAIKGQEERTSAEEEERLKEAELEMKTKDRDELLEKSKQDPRWSEVNKSLAKAGEYFRKHEADDAVWRYVSEDLVRSADIEDRIKALETLNNVIELAENDSARGQEE